MMPLSLVEEVAGLQEKREKDKKINVSCFFPMALLLAFTGILKHFFAKAEDWPFCLDRARGPLSLLADEIGQAFY